MTITEITQTVADYYKVDQLLIYSRSRNKIESIARQISIHFALKYTRLSKTKIGAILSCRSHSVVVYSNKCVIELASVDKAFKKELINIENELLSKTFQ